jgi:hypothetical protein
LASWCQAWVSLMGLQLAGLVGRFQQPGKARMSERVGSGWPQRFAEWPGDSVSLDAEVDAGWLHFAEVGASRSLEVRSTP